MELSLLHISLEMKSPAFVTFAIGFATSKFFDWFRSKPIKERKPVDINNANKAYASDDFYERFKFYAPPRLRNAITQFYVKRSTNTGMQEKFFKSISSNLDIDEESGRLVVKLRWYDYPIIVILIFMMIAVGYYIFYSIANFSQLGLYAVPVIIAFALLLVYYFILGWPYINFMRMKKMLQ